jgi:predicted RNase H-like nuclease (RuvC/YqgF family)
MTKREISQAAGAVEVGSHMPEVISLREHLADLRAENARLEAELHARRREIATLHSMLGQMMRGPWVYVDDDQSPRWA